MKRNTVVVIGLVIVVALVVLLAWLKYEEEEGYKKDPCKPSSWCYGLCGGPQKCKCEMRHC